MFRSRFIILLILLAAPLRADDSVTLENARAIAPQRHGGPLYLTGELHYHGQGILEGTLSYRITAAGTTVASLESDPKVLTRGITRFRQILPVPPSKYAGSGFAGIEVRFRTEDADYDLQSIPVRLADVGDMAYVLLQIRSSLDSDAELDKFREPLALANAEPAIGARPFYNPTIFAEELPEQPLAYCAFDGVVITPQGLAAMTGRRLEALAEWTRAGGAVCIHLGDETSFEPKHVEFLNSLFRDAGHPPWLLGEKGHLQMANFDGGLLADDTGLGFTIVTRALPTWESRPWRVAFARFWHLGRDGIESLNAHDLAVAVNRTPSEELSRRDRELLRDQQMQRQQQIQGQYAKALYGSMYTTLFETPAIGRKVFEELRPNDIRLLPGWVLAGVLMVYVLMVGPVDWLLLGWLKKRRWTWLTFPLVTIALTAGLVGMANAFMGAAMEPRSVTIIDCDADGVPVRVNRLEFYFESLSREFVHEQQGTTFSPLDPAYFHAAPDAYRPGAGWVPPNRWERSTIENDAATGPYRGTFPSRYTVAQQVAKWTPQVNRTMAFASKIEMPEIDWDAVAKPEIRTIELNNGRTARVLHVAGDKELRDALLAPLPQGMAMPGAGMMMPGGGRMANQGPTKTLPQLLQVTYRELGLLITLRAPGASGRSPLGLGWLDDLPLVDPADPNSQAVVIEVQESDGGITFYRKPVRTDSDRSEAQE